MTAIREEQVLAALRELETTRWEEVLDFIGYLRQHGKPKTQRAGAETLTARALAASGLVGLWADRTDLPDSPEYARQLRRQAELRTQAANFLCVANPGRSRLLMPRR
jgi:hypothetical protein